MLNPGKEIIGWEICREKVVGLKIFKIDCITEKFIYASFEDWRGSHQLKFSSKTGKEWRIKPWEPYFHLENRRIIR